jgi:hypothetical protein
MNTIEKENQQKKIVTNIKGIETATAEAVKVKDTYRGILRDLNMHGTQTFSPEYLEKEINKIKGDFAAKMTAVNTNMVKRLDDLQTLIQDRDSVLDLGNPALSSAMTSIQTIGSSLSHEQAVKINQNFYNDQNALNMIRSAYQVHDVINTGKIDGLIYDVESEIEKLKELAYDGFVREGSINTFANRLAKLAEIEGVTIEKNPDKQSLDDSWRRGAGLKVN